jgi:hypothetical protein
MLFTLVGPAGSDTPHAIARDGWRHGEPASPAEVPMARLDADSDATAVSQFLRIRESGVRDFYGQQDRRDDGPWRTKGAPHYLKAQAYRLVLTPGTASHPRVLENRQNAKIAGLLGQVQRDYYNAPRYGDDRAFSSHQIRQIAGILEQCETELGKTHAIAAAGTAMVDEAWEAVGLTPPDRGFRIVAASDAPIESVEVASLRSELDRLRADNESLAERPTTPESPDKSPHPKPKSRPDKIANQD